MFLKKRKTRIAAAVTAFFLAAGAVFILTDALYRYHSYGNLEDVVPELSDYSDEANRIIRDSWLYVNMDMLRKSTDSVFLKNSVAAELDRAGIADSAGRFTPDTSLYCTLLEKGSTVYSNTDSFPENSRYTADLMIDRGGCFWNQMPEVIDTWVGGNGEIRCYTNTKGMYYFYCCGRGYAVYDYDTTGLESFIDDLGAKIYLNRDGTTPVPAVYNTSGSYRSFDAENEIYQNKMQLTELSRASVKIAPNEAAAEKLDVWSARREKSEADIVSCTMVALLFAGLAAVLSLYLIIMSGYNEVSGQFEMRIPDRIFGEFAVAGGIVLPAVVCLLGAFTYDSFIESFQRMNVSELSVAVPVSIGAAVAFMMAVVSAGSVVNRFRCHMVMETSLVFRAAFRVIANMRKNEAEFRVLHGDVFTISFLTRLGVALLAGIAAVVIGAVTSNLIILTFCCMLVVLFYIAESMRDLKALNRLERHISSMGSGDYSPKHEDETSVIYGMTSKLNCISDGIQNAVEEQIRSERMKIELVTNVSHDLKTPLTSVISYVDLLSKEELTPAAADYVAVLEQKTTRLKTIVSDVFDLAKATSSTDIALERIDFVILFRQVLADMEDRISEYGREIKTEINAESAFISAEGKKMYRVIQNVIDNALKYSMKGTRIFAKLTSEDGRVKITVRNTASYEMNFTPDEITERFTRGDKSRTTEGSGLGLSIAKSFTEACGGKFTVSIDGDVFCAETEFETVTQVPDVQVQIPDMEGMC